VPNRLDLQNLSQTRLHEAEVLFDAGLFDGSFYLCGYVVELAMKACVCRHLGVEEYPESEPNLKGLFRTHDFRSLELVAGLRSSVSAKRQASLTFDDNWTLATSWKPEDRYLLNSKNQNEAHDMLEAVRSAPEGVLTWLSQQW
jgi:HEPN domain-containing protein